MVRFVRRCLKATAMGAAILPRTALAGWGDENWGEMVWGQTLSVPTLGLLGLGILALALASAAAWGLRKRAWGMSVLLVVLAIPLAVAAGTLSVPNTFVNGEAADADEVNANFDVVETEVNDNDSRITAAQSAADAAAAGHTVDTNTQLTTSQVAAAAVAEGFVHGAHTTDTNTQLTNSQVAAAAAAAGFVAGPHTTDTTLNETAVDAFVANNGYAAATAHGPHERQGASVFAVGSSALLNNSNGYSNSAHGIWALKENVSGHDNTAVGQDALKSNVTGHENTALGTRALVSNIAGDGNVGIGWQTLAGNRASGNVGVGAWALMMNATGYSNVAVGHQALRWNTATGNTALGSMALHYQNDGFNIAVGKDAGFNTTGSQNILIGNQGVPGESNTIRIGEAAPTHDRAFIAGIRGTTTSSANAVAVLIDSYGQLGTVSSSARYKDDIEPMANRSAVLGALRPVTFRYKQAYADGSKPLQYGLVAEEVAEVFPELVVFDDEGQPETVKYRWLSSLLLNEFQKLTARHETVAQRVTEKDAAIAQLQEENESMRQRLALLDALPERLAMLEAQVGDMTQVVRTGATGPAHLAMHHR